MIGESARAAERTGSVLHNARSVLVVPDTYIRESIRLLYIHIYTLNLFTRAIHVHLYIYVSVGIKKKKKLYVFHGGAGKKKTAREYRKADCVYVCICVFV